MTRLPAQRLSVFSGLATVLATSLVMTGCAGGPQLAAAGADTSETTTIRYEGSANNVSLLEVAEDLGYLRDLELEWVGNSTSGPQSIQSVATGQTDIGGAFTGAVVKLVEAGAPIQAVINYYGEDELTFTGYYVAEDSPIQSPRDLIGKKVAVNTLGAHHEAVINLYLQDAGLTPEEVKQVQLVVVPPNDTEQALRRGQVDVGTLGGVLQDTALANGGIRPLFTDTEVVGGPFDAGQYVLRKDFTAQNPETARTLVTGIAEAIEWERTTPREEVIARFTEIINERGRAESTAALQHWKSVGVAAHGGTISDTDFTRWNDYLRGAGVIDSDINPAEIYTNEFNDLAEEAQQ